MTIAEAFDGQRRSARSDLIYELVDYLIPVIKRLLVFLRHDGVDSLQDADDPVGYGRVFLVIKLNASDY